MSHQLFDKLENAIDSGAPAASLKPLLITLREQWEALEERLELATTKYAELAAQSKEAVSPTLEAELDKVLVAMLPMDPDDEAVLAQKMGYSEPKMLALLQELEKRRLVAFRLGPGWEPSYYYLLPSGRNYLLHKGLI